MLLPSREAGGWRGAPLLHWRVQCPGRVCAALAAGPRGFGPVPGFVSSPFPPSRPAFPALCVAGRPVWVSLILASWYAIPCGLCVPRARSDCPSGIPRVSFACACARALAASAPPPPPWVGVAHAPREVPVLGAGMAIPRGPCPTRVSFLSPVLRLGCLGRGGPGPVSPLPGLGLCAPHRAGPRVKGVPAPGGGGGEGGLCAVLPGGAAGGPREAGGRPTSVRPSAFPEQAKKRVSLASLWSWRAWPPYCSGPCGSGPRGSRRVGAWGRVAYGLSCAPPRAPQPFQEEGGPPLLPREGWRSGDPAARGPEKGSGRTGKGGARRGSPLSSSGGLACGPRPIPPFFAGASPPGILFRPRLFGTPGRGLAGRQWVSLAGGKGAVDAPSPLRGSAEGPRGAGGGKVSLPPSVSPPSPGGHQGGSLRLCPPLNTALAHVRVPPSCCGPRGALERRRRAAGLPRAPRQ